MIDWIKHLEIPHQVEIWSNYNIYEGQTSHNKLVLWGREGGIKSVSQQGLLNLSCHLLLIHYIL